MFNFDDIGSTYISLPPNLQTVESDCFGYALDKQMQKFHALAKQLTIWSDMDHTAAKYYDYMALCIKAPYYKSEYDQEMKLSLLKTAIESNRYAGTQKAINQLIDIVFEKAFFIPWYEYDGEPYHFKPYVYDDVLTEEAVTIFANIIKKVKAARSVMDNITIGRESHGEIFLGAAMKSITKIVIMQKEENNA